MRMPQGCRRQRASQEGTGSSAQPGTEPALGSSATLLGLQVAAQSGATWQSAAYTRPSLQCPPCCHQMLCLQVAWCSRVCLPVQPPHSCVASCVVKKQLLVQCSSFPKSMLMCRWLCPIRDTNRGSSGYSHKALWLQVAVPDGRKELRLPCPDVPECAGRICSFVGDTHSCLCRRTCSFVGDMHCCLCRWQCLTMCRTIRQPSS